MSGLNFIDKYWQENPLVVKDFLNRQQKHLLLCQEITFILKNLLSQEKIEYSAVTHRAKTLNSFIEKVQRKKYDNPFKEITDFSGVRVVFLYVSDYEKIEKLILRTFKVIEKVDKLNEKKEDQFGYGAIHFIVKLGSNFKGTRYDEITDYSCEIQVRTILQDAWAVIDHHLVYKKEEDVPSHLKRKLNSLAGLFETADDQFQKIREERLAYIGEIKQISNSPEKFLEIDLNMDSFVEFLNWKYKNFELSTFEKQVEMIFKDIDKRRYKKLSDLNNIYIYAEKFIEKVKVETAKIEKDDKIVWSKVLDFGLRLVIYDKDIRKKRGVPYSWLEVVEKLNIQGNSKRPK